MLYLGIDQSLESPGLAILDQEGTAIQVSHLSVGGKKRGAQRLSLIVSWIESAMKDAIHSAGSLFTAGCLEGYSVNSCNRPFDLGEVSGAIRLWLLNRYGLDLWVVEPTRLKKFATGSGVATKDEVLHAVKTVWGLDLKQDDEGDAYVLAQIARAASIQVFSKRHQAEVVKDLLNPPQKPRRPRTTTPQNL